jgi:hypothetical protein
MALAYYTKRIRNRFNIETISLIQPEFLKVSLQVCNVLFKYYKWGKGTISTVYIAGMHRALLTV